MNDLPEANTETKTLAVGGVGRSALAQAVLRATGRQPEEKADPINEESGVASPGDAEKGLFNLPDDGAPTPGDIEPGEAEPELNVWQFGDQEYTAEQVTEIIQERETYQRYNQSVKPLIEAIQQAETTNARFKEMALTETELEMRELVDNLSAGRYDQRQELAARKRIDQLKKRQETLSEAADRAAKEQAETLNQVRVQNARQTVAKLVKSGWTNEQVQAVGAAAGNVLGAKLSDVISPELLQVFQDAIKYRTAQDNAYRTLKKKAADPLKTQRQSTTQPTQARKPATFGQKVWGDRYK